MAKASQQDIDRLTEFFQFLEEAIEQGTYTRTANDDQDEQESHEIDDDMLCGMLRARWIGVSCSWMRVVFGCGVLIDNCCDPDKSYLDWKPEVRKLLEVAEASDGNGGGK